MSLTPGSGSAADHLLGERYLLDDLVARGATAEVYRAHDRLLERPVAVKIFHAHSDPVARQRFDEEAYVLARLAHPGLAQIFDVGMVEDRPFLVMEFIDGEDLRFRLCGGPLPPEGVMRIGGVLADALAHAHSRGVVHRDVKPANIMLDRDELPHLTDFGIAVLSGAPRPTDANAIVGTPAYLAPEQLLGEEAGPPADVYALALVLLECLTGEVEYPAGSNVASALTRLSRPPRIPAGLPPALAGLLSAMTSAEPTARPSAEECTRQLLAPASEPTAVQPTAAQPTAIAAEPIAWWADEDRTAAAPAVSTRPATGSTRRGWGSLAAAGVGIAGVAAALVFLVNYQPSLPGQPASGSPAEHTTSRPVTSGGAGQAGSGGAGGRAGSGSAPGTLVVNERPALTVVPSSSPTSVPPSTDPPTSASPSSSPPTTSVPPTTTSPPPPTTTSGAPGNGTGLPNP
jgi:serine/threonine protein kinase